jgi:broad specificity phosphatase PhoE
LEGRAQGHTDIPLDEVGLEQARALAAGFDPGCPIRTVYTSDLLRASQTARALAGRLGADLQFRRDLRERSFGEYEGQVFTEFSAWRTREAARLGIHEMHVTPQNAETWQQVWERLGRFVVEIEAGVEPCVVVTHGGTGSLLVARLVRGSIETSRSFSFGNTGVTELELRPEGFYKILRYNDTSHLGRSAVLSGSVEGSTR